MIRRKNLKGVVEEVRPQFDYAQARYEDGWSLDQCQAQLTEDIRNVLEQIRDKQTLQCDVAGAIKDMAKQIRGLRRDLAKKRRRTK